MELQHSRLNKAGRMIIAAIAILTLFAIVIGKIIFTSKLHPFFYGYGITVTALVLFTFLITFIKYRDPVITARNKSKNYNSNPLVSCVLGVYNEEKIITKCIDSLIASTYKNREIIIVNDASTDNTKKVLEKYSKYPGVKIINLEKNIGKKKAIGQGLRIAKGEIFVFTDSDSVLAPDAIEKIIDVFVSDPSVGAVSGHGRALNANENLLTKIQDSWYETQFSVEKALESIYGSVSCVSGPLAVFRRSAIYNYIPAWEADTFLGQEFRFATDRQLTGYVLGSQYIGDKLKKKYANSPFVKGENYPTRDWNVVYCNSAKVWTVVPNTFKKLVRQHIRWKKSFIRNLFFTGTFYWRKPIIPSLKYYLGALFTILGPFIVLRHLIYLPINGDALSGIYYLSGILFIGALYGLAFKINNPKSSAWIYRPFMSVISTLTLSWLIFYSLITINSNVWYRG